MSQQKTWQERFDKIAVYTNEYGYVHPIPTAMNIKIFIAQILEEEKERLVGEIKDIVLHNSVEEYIGSDSFLIVSTDKLMFAFNNLIKK